MQYHTSGNQLILENGITVEFALPIRQAIDVSGIMIVALDVPPHETMNENVFGVSSEGKVLWQIERIPQTSTPVCRYVDLTERLPDSLLTQLERIPQFKGLSQYGPGTFVAGNWGGTEAIVDARTGKVLRTFFLK